MDWFFYIVIFITGIVTGFINILAGSGSFITLSILIYFFNLHGIAEPTKLANGTKRIAILLQNMTATLSFNKEKLVDWKGVLYLAPPTVIGSILGSYIAVNMNEELMNKIIAVIMVIMIFFILKNPKKWLEGQVEKLTQRPKLLVFVFFFFIGVYGGFIQAGVGIFFLVAMVMTIGYNVVRANAMKVAVNFIMTAFAIIMFALNGSVDWQTGIVLSIGSIIGAKFGTSYTIKHGSDRVQLILIVVMAFSAVYLFAFA